ncbi:sensor histidine kinase [Halalkalibacter alkaliphilus]|uniref:histidine kinase n=2 Tax=Bacillaceae TaxID=186817 RepID=A0A9X1ZVR9_9BACI|nr:ATP-binding protein [Halalkalibacter alkaliphilus]MCL7745533.1 ATP-binding protein [Halalkalibacter alkaliphilus]
MGLRPRLIIAFLSIIILPIVTFFGTLSFFTNQLEQLEGEQNNEIEYVLSEINETVLENYDVIGDTEQFYNKIKPVIEPYHLELIVSTKEKVVLFQSTDHIPDKDERMFTLRHSQVQTLTGEILNIEIKSSSLDLSSELSYRKILTSIIISLSSGLIVLVLLMVGWTLYISKTILHPLKEIYTATEEMRDGNLNYEIHYKRNDEIGRFIKGFNTMRDHLKLSIAKQQLYENNRKELIATISHDLRTPLQSIKGYVEGIKDGIVQNEEMKNRYLNVILSKTDQLNRLIDDLFEFSKLDLDQLVMEKQLVSSNDFFTKILCDAEVDVKQKQGQLVVKKPIPDVVINIDRKRMEQVFTNLLDNAVRYGASEIKIAFAVNVKKTTLEIHITDNGDGISEEDIERIFERFYRGEKSRSREHGGTGLGLAIVKSIMKAHDGEIKAESKLGEGSKFVIVIPVIKGADR